MINSILVNLDNILKSFDLKKIDKLKFNKNAKIIDRYEDIYDIFLWGISIYEIHDNYTTGDSIHYYEIYENNIIYCLRHLYKFKYYNVYIPLNCINHIVINEYIKDLINEYMNTISKKYLNKIKCLDNVLILEIKEIILQYLV